MQSMLVDRKFQSNSQNDRIYFSSYNEMNISSQKVIKLWVLEARTSIIIAIKIKIINFIQVCPNLVFNSDWHSIISCDFVGHQIFSNDGAAATIS